MKKWIMADPECGMCIVPYSTAKHYGNDGYFVRKAEVSPDLVKRYNDAKDAFEAVQHELGEIFRRADSGRGERG